ncbi:hypothetical protein FB45DRAFT_1024083 [Roridomyces roridus]|uniref:Vacuolar protein sorting-associated protein 13 second N-terminal domain-containing protein n=1 Tax=Roridomyces roridus TaxID=1738132 RepID=A0AAD7C5Q7_9AGAR|nr:hypothetical protein FB45DRAFT_1024083 [Roridomyces roridus]
MPMPKLLKKLSSKSLKAKSEDFDNPPPLPGNEYESDNDEGYDRARPRLASSRTTPADAARPNSDWLNHSSSRSMDASVRIRSKSASRPSSRQHNIYHQGSAASNSHVSFVPSRMGSDSSGLPAEDLRARAYPPPPQPPPAITGLQPSASPRSMSPAIPSPPSPPEDDLTKDLAGAWQTAITAPKQSKADKLLQSAENSFIQGQAKEAKFQAIETGVVTALTAVGGMEVIEQGIHSLVDAMPALMKGLDEVAKLHPVIGVAVMAFKAVWALEEKRRANDKMILTLHMEMKDMMAVLIQLKSIKDANEVAPDGTTINGRMQGVIHGTADDIKACGLACDTYTKKKTIVKVLTGPSWSGKLTGFAGTFTKRRGEFEFALSIHTALGVDAANRAISAVDKTTQEMNAKMDMMMKMFQNFMSPDQAEMARLVEQRGGLDAVKDNDKMLQELSDIGDKAAGGGAQTQLVGAKGSANANNKAAGLEGLRDELNTDPDAAIQKNATAFDRKFAVQTRQIVEEVSKEMARQGDRIISAITAGPHDKILDPDVHAVWKLMNWKGSVKHRHFVTALRDHYTEGGSMDEMSAPKTSERGADDWALAYLSVSRLQSISEAFDDDASGFVTVTEANTFTSSRPLDWSLKKWLAFWAIGWHQSMNQYVKKIRELLAKMFALRVKVLPINRGSVNQYLDSIHHFVTSLYSGVNPCYVNDGLQEKFNSYVEAEEARLRGNLEAVSYDIDALNTLYLVVGHGRIERFLLPLIYLLLERDFQIIRACQKKIVHPDELWDSADTIGWAEKAARERMDLLEATFKQQMGADLKQQFNSFANGMFQYFYDPSGLWDPKTVLAQDEPEYPYDDSFETKNVNLSKILNYPLGTETLDFDAYKPVAKPKKSPTRPAPALKSLLGSWNGFLYASADATVPTSGMLSMELSANGNLTFAASSRANMSDFTISGECITHDEHIVTFSFKQTFPSRFTAVYFSGSWTSETECLSGTWGEESNARTHPGVFIFRRTAPEAMCFFPAPTALRKNKSRALWSFAIEAVRYGVRRDGWAWSFFQQRADKRKRFIELYIRNTRFGKPLDDTEQEELREILKLTAAADSRFLHSLAEKQIRMTADHDVSCDACKGHIGGIRVTCLSCRLDSEDTFDTVDFCSTGSCMSAKVVPTGLTKFHLPTHDIVKIRRVVHVRQFGRTYRQAKLALERSRVFFPSTAENDKDTQKSKIEGPRCAVCRRDVVQPCWFCIQCDEPRFICNSCETRPRISFPGHDFDNHDLVRCQASIEPKEFVLEERLTDIERRFERHQAHIDEKLQGLERRMDERMCAVDQRLVKMDKLLQCLVSSLALGKPPKLAAEPKSISTSSLGTYFDEGYGR